MTHKTVEVPKWGIQELQTTYLGVDALDGRMKVRKRMVTRRPV